MTILCINPDCRRPENSDNNMFCDACGSELLLAGRYRTTALLSDKGGFGKTYEVTHNGDAKVLKILTNNQPKAVELFEREYRVLNQLNHPGIPQGEHYFTFFPCNSSYPLYCLVMEYIRGMDLEEYQKRREMRPIEQKIALEWLLQLAQILDAVHSSQFFHRDIKPSNIILKPDGQLVLIDFGGARQVTATIMAGGRNTAIYTPGYAPPEQEKGYAVPKSDFYALGRTMVYLLTGKQPTAPELYNPNTDEFLWRNYAPKLSAKLGNFIDKLMERSASNRPADTQVILQELERIDLPSPPSPQQRKRRQFIKVAVGLTSGGLVTAVLGKLLPNVFSPKTPNSPLSDFSFQVETLNSRGGERSRQRLQAEYFQQSLGNGVTIDMVSIPGGTFMMGSPKDEEGRDDKEGPQRERTIAPFFMGKYPVTQAQWLAVMNYNPSNWKGENLPVENVSWNDAVEFCQRLSRQTGRDYRLPSEAEWEYACRAGTTTPFHFGETITADLANYNSDYTYADGPKGIYRQKTTPVGSFGVANAFGLYDIHGNVWEWCADPWHENYQGAPSDGRVWQSGGDDSRRMRRGGSWDNNPIHCRSAFRNRDSPDYRYSSFGLRVASSSPVRTS